MTSSDVGCSTKSLHMTIFDAQEFGTVLLPASGFLPEFCRLHHRHQQFNRSGANHFVADNVFNFADDAKAKRHVGIYAGGKLLDHAGANHVLLADDVGIAGASLRVEMKKERARISNGGTRRGVFRQGA